ncbi:MAG: hypothetical protein K2W97_02000 [Chthoniobacterales bacterium]|nr:hypothetical protein [Chthoniobacterales bacterium]
MELKLEIYFILFVIFLSPFLRGDSTETSTYLKHAEEAYVQNHLKEASLKSHEALLSISENSIITQEQHAAVIKDFTKYSIAYAKLLANERHFQEAREQLQLILLPNANPADSEALHLLNYLQSFHDDSQSNKNNETRKTTRANLLLDVEKNWIPSTNSITSLESSPEKEANLLKKETLSTKLQTIILPTVELEDTTLDEAVDYFKEKSRDADPSKEGVNIVIKSSNIDSEPAEKNNTSSTNSTPLLPASQKSESRLNLELHEVPLAVALEYLAQQAGFKVEINSYAVSLEPPSLCTGKLLTQEYDIPTSFFSNKETYLSALPVKDFFQAQGIEFPEGSSATYFSSFNKLIVRNTPNNLDLISTLINSVIKSPPLQISIETKFIEINQNDLSELGFNWLLGSFSLGGSGLEMSGGGSDTGLNTTAYPFPTEGMNPVGALRSDNQAINDTSIDSVLEGNAHNTTMERSIPGVFSIGGVCSTPQFQMVIRALNQKKGIDLMAAPHVTTKNGAKATIKIVDEFIYPTQYAPPQIPTSTATTNSYGAGLRHTPPTITPSFPNTWTSKNLGVTLEAKPTITPDHKMIALELHPQITDFDGFINYGTPINTVGYNVTATNMSSSPFSETLTTNTINQPVFTVREVNTSVMVKDGQTVIIGGLIREEIQHVEDKIPFLGDIPLAGRLFRSKSERKLKKNLIIFVTPKILNADGAPYQHPEILPAPCNLQPVI